MNDPTHVVIAKVRSPLSSLPSRPASHSIVQQKASRREMSDLRRTTPRSESLLQNPISPRLKQGMHNFSKERSHTPATQIQTHVISDRADDVPFLGFKEKRGTASSKR